MFKSRFCTLVLASVNSLVVYPSLGGGFTEDFSHPPEQRAWKVFGSESLFKWNSTNQNLEVTWDSAQPNSYYYRELGTILTKSDDFSFSFDLRLSDVIAGVNAQKPGPFSLSVGLLNVGEATQTNFVRGTGFNSPDLVEFSYFPDPGGAWIYGPSLTSVLVDATGTNWSTGGFGAQGLTTDDLYHVGLTYTSSNQTLRTVITRNGLDYGQVSDTHLTTNFLDFRVDCLAICSYSDAGQEPAYAGSVLAYGMVDNLTAVTPAPPVSLIEGSWAGQQWGVRFSCNSNWVYVLERTEDFGRWVPITPATPGTTGDLLLRDPNPPSDRAFYRVNAQRP